MNIELWSKMYCIYKIADHFEFKLQMGGAGLVIEPYPSKLQNLPWKMMIKVMQSNKFVMHKRDAWRGDFIYNPKMLSFEMESYPKIYVNTKLGRPH